jgi:predicted TIM-barrel fold metal-dependent hydrolase
MTFETMRPARIVDAHVHLWDPECTDWYPYLSTQQEQLKMGDVSGMSRRFDVSTYFSETAGWGVDKLVNIAAATGDYSIEETLAINDRADIEGYPNAIIGGLPPADGTADAVDALDRQLAAPRFRGVRPMGSPGGALPRDEVLQAIQERDLIFEVMTHPDRLVEAAKGLERHADLMVVLEHTGWPRNDSDEERALWRKGLDAMAGIGTNVVCKLSGLAMPLGSMTVEAMTPWVEYAIELFGVDRCFFASNFPVDGMHGTLGQLWGAYSSITASLSTDQREKLFAANAERIYRC